MISLAYQAPGAERSRTLLVMLPGAGIEAADFAGNGMIAALHERGFAVDVIAAQPDLSLYLDDGVAGALHRAVIEPALQAGFLRVWLLGISLGGMGALHYASRYQDIFGGLILLAPFLGTQGTIAEIIQGGGLAQWRASSSTPPVEARLLTWLQSALTRPGDAAKFYLGYGEADRFAAGHRHLAAALPAGQVVTKPGGHDWETWLALWHAWLDNPAFAAQLDGAAGR